MKAGALLEQALLAGALLKEARPVRKMWPEYLMLILMIFLGLAGVGFFIYAGFVWGAARYGVQSAALGTGALIWAFVFCSMGFLLMSRRRRSLKKVGKQMGRQSEDALMNALESLEEPIRNNPKVGIILAALMGYKTGKSMF
jgi:hypothetical protein